MERNGVKEEEGEGVLYSETAHTLWPQIAAQIGHKPPHSIIACHAISQPGNETPLDHALFDDVSWWKRVVLSIGCQQQILRQPHSLVACHAISQPENETPLDHALFDDVSWWERVVLSIGRQQKFLRQCSKLRARMRHEDLSFKATRCRSRGNTRSFRQGQNTRTRHSRQRDTDLEAMLETSGNDETRGSVF